MIIGIDEMHLVFENWVGTTVFLLKWKNAWSGFITVGYCMGYDELAVVDAELKVLASAATQVIDASVMPNQKNILEKTPQW